MMYPPSAYCAPYGSKEIIRISKKCLIVNIEYPPASPERLAMAGRSNKEFRMSKYGIAFALPFAGRLK
jgi:hypothetical protein